MQFMLQIRIATPVNAQNDRLYDTARKSKGEY